MAVDVPSITLTNGIRIPQIGFGTYLMFDEDSCLRSVRQALATGYRHIDTARMYQNEAFIGGALRNSDIPRERLYLTSKIPPNHMGYE